MSVWGSALFTLYAGSSFGAILDMLTDRFVMFQLNNIDFFGSHSFSRHLVRGSVICLYTILCVFFPAYAPVFMIAGFLDIVSHYAHMYKSVVIPTWVIHHFYVGP